MNIVPYDVLKSAPLDTEWHGGSVDKIVTSLRVMPKGINSEREINNRKIENIIGKAFQKRPRGWVIKARASINGNLDKQINAIMNKLPKSKRYWDSIVEIAEIDLFVGLFLYRMNRGIEISPSSMQLLCERNIKLSLDIYGP